MDWTWFEQLDRVRRMQGAALDALGLSPQETPHTVVHGERGVALRRYGGDAASGPVVLIVPAPIKRPYIWDLAPEVSVVRRCLAIGARVFLAEWQPAPPEFGLADYAGRLLLECLDAAGGEPAVLLGHSLGGLFAAIFSALHPQRVRGLALLVSPLNFGPEAPVFSRMAAALDAEQLPDSMPGSYLGIASFNAAPGTFGWERWADGALSLADAGALRRHIQIERWSLDEFPLPRRLVADLLTRIVRENRFARGTLEIDGRGAAPAQLTAPLLCVIDAHCAVVPPDTVLPVFEAAGSGDKTLLHYEREPGVSLQHVGPLAGPRAHASLWPRIPRWMQAH
jgi:polyhydroxyalkanoate synthase